jgi:hypothetical protein
MAERRIIDDQQGSLRNLRFAARDQAQVWRHATDQTVTASAGTETVASRGGTQHLTASGVRIEPKDIPIRRYPF